MKKPSIYPDRSQELLTLFEQAGNNSKLMCVPIDYAKEDLGYNFTAFDWNFKSSKNQSSSYPAKPGIKR